MPWGDADGRGGGGSERAAGTGSAGAGGAETDRAGRVLVGADLTLPGHPELFAIGDLARIEQDGAPLPGVAPVAMAPRTYVAKVIAARAAGRAVPPPFRYRDKGMMATIGRSKAVCDLGWIRYAGLPAWLTWLFVHVLFLVEFESRILVLVQWAWNYLTRNRGTRLITGAEVLPLPIGRDATSLDR